LIFRPEKRKGKKSKGKETGEGGVPGGLRVTFFRKGHGGKGNEILSTKTTFPLRLPPATTKGREKNKLFLEKPPS